MSSPIEDALLDALVPVLAEHDWKFAICGDHDDAPRRSPPESQDRYREVRAIPDCKVFLASPVRSPCVGVPTVLACRQATEAGYRVDILLRLRVGGGPGRPFDAVIAVECDGHDWHERTKQQAEYDRARDRELLIGHGIVTIRFTGSEIHRDANQCARDCQKALLAVAQIAGAFGGKAE